MIQIESIIFVNFPVLKIFLLNHIKLDLKIFWVELKCTLMIIHIFF